MSLKDRAERATGMIWGRYRLGETFGHTEFPQPALHIMLHPKNSDLVRIEGGIGRRGFYLHWGMR